MIKEILTIFFSVITICTYGQKETLIVDSLTINTGCLGLSYKITITNNLYTRHTSDAMYGTNDTTIHLTSKQISNLNKEIKKVRKIKSRDRIKKVNYSCPCYRNIIITDSGKKKDLGKYISTSRPPLVFRKIDKIIDKIE